VDAAVLHALLRGVAIDLSSQTAAQESASALTSLLAKNEVVLEVQFDEKTESHRLLIKRMLHGNQRLSVLDRDFVESGDYQQIRRTSGVLQGLVATGARIKRGDSETPVSDFQHAVEWLLEQVQHGLTVQRYKGLGEMNPEQLWETTMDPESRRLLRAQIEDAIAADEIFTTLMGDVVEPRRAFIEANALGVRNLDI
jgi:DNA gyrase subunit B